MTTYQQPPTATSPTHEETRTPLRRIATATGHLYKQTFGRGPTTARASFAGPDVLVVTLEGSLTVPERNLVALGDHTRLRDWRSRLHAELERQLRAVVEEALGRRTLAFAWGIDCQRDVSITLFTLAPPSANGHDATAPAPARAAAQDLHPVDAANYDGVIASRRIQKATHRGAAGADDQPWMRRR